MKFRIFSSAILLLLAAACNNTNQENATAQPPEGAYSGNDESSLGEDQDESVKLVVLTLFDGVRESNKNKILGTLADDAQFISARKIDGELVEKITQGTEFAEKAGAVHEQAWDERLADIRVELQDEQAMLFANYEFYLGQDYSHKGEMTVTLLRSDSEWLIEKVWYTVVKD
jgi:hypothetical protein